MHCYSRRRGGFVALSPKGTSYRHHEKIGVSVALCLSVPTQLHCRNFEILKQWSSVDVRWAEQISQGLPCVFCRRFRLNFASSQSLVCRVASASIRRNLPSSHPAHFLPRFLSSVSFNTFFTIFCSSIKNARTIRSRTQLPHLEPPYARCTVFWGLLVVAYSLGRRAGTCIYPPSIRIGSWM